MQDYNALRSESARMGEHNDCAVKAVAVAMNVPYKEAHTALAKAGRRPRKGTYFHETETATKALGGELKRTKEFNSKTVTTLERELKRKAPGRIFYIRVNRHILAFDGKKVQDWTSGRRHRIQEVHEVIREGARPEPVAAKSGRITNELRVRKLVSCNPRKPGTHGHAHWLEYCNGQTVAELKRWHKFANEVGDYKGGMNHVKWDIEHGYIELY